MRLTVFILSFLFLLASRCTSNTEEPEPYRVFVKSFTKHFNQGDFAAIAAAASPSFLASVPEARLTEFLSGIRNDFGAIQDISFTKFDAKGSAVYYAELTETLFNFIIGLDEQNRMQRLVITSPNYNEHLPMVENKTKMQLPFEGTWFVFWGGDTESDNYHVTAKAQKNAFDFVVRDSLNKSYKTDGKTNEDYYCFAQKITAPCSGEVVKVLDGVADNVPGEMNPSQLTGNTVVIKSAANEYVLMAHFKINSISVKEGDRVTMGQTVGLCGNSGNSSEPHLHLHIMDGPDLEKSTGIKCYFEKIEVNGALKQRYSPIQGEYVKKRH